MSSLLLSLVLIKTNDIYITIRDYQYVYIIIYNH